MSEKGRAVVLLQSGHIESWSRYTQNNKPLQLEESMKNKKMAVVIPKRISDQYRAFLKEPVPMNKSSYGRAHISDSVCIRDFTDPSTFRRQRRYTPEEQEMHYTHFNIHFYK
jgi:cell division protein FtsN